ncbi:MAG: DUF1538 domain-containing protein, partial [Spirochaetia bacterium]|nr:DUF1538 domain-containing protein [Spirochaetia bacterium]
MSLVKKLKETTISIVPLILIVIVLNLTIASVGWGAVGLFVLGSIAIIVGLSLFLLGNEIGIYPNGNRIGSGLMKKKNLKFLLLNGFLIGLVITIAEPQVQVLAQQVTNHSQSISRMTLVVSISLGVGLFVAISFARIIFSISYRWLLIGFYALIMILSLFVDQFFLGIAYDAGGATTGPMTVPFILALGVGLAGVRKTSHSEEDSFGLVGIASIGPVLAVLVMALVAKGAPVAMAGDESIQYTIVQLFESSSLEVLQALGPLVVLLGMYHVALLHLSRYQLIRTIQGLVYAALGLILFLVGVNGAFMPIGSAIGKLIGSSEQVWLLIPIGLFLGAVVVLAEPAVWVLTDQVRDVSGGSIKKSMVLLFFSIGVSIAVALAMLRVVYQLPLLYFLFPGYLIALLMTYR